MKSNNLAAVVIGALALSILPVAITNAANETSNSKSANGQANRPEDFWTADRIKKAEAFDMVFDEGSKTGKRVIVARSTKPPGGTTTPSVLGTSWTKLGLPLTASGKVFFAIGTSYYQCSGALVRDGSNSKSMVLTAGHCVFDNATSRYVTNFIFIPSYDVNQVTISGCSITAKCWGAKGIEAHPNFTSQTAFTAQATKFDWGFATITASTDSPLPDGGTAGSGSDGTNSFPISFSNLVSSTLVSSFGYPAAGKYNGFDLIYSSGAISFDSQNSNSTYKLASDMTGGCSGGPWLSKFASVSPYSGTLSSVNSYKYGTTTFIYGPKFSSETTATYQIALAKS